MYLFPTDAQTNADCQRVFDTLQRVISGTRMFIVRFEPEPLREQVPMMLQLQAE